MISSTARPSAPVSAGSPPESDAVDEVAHLLREAVVPELVEHRERPPARLGRLLDRVAVAVLAVGQKRRAAQDVDVGDAVGPDQLGAIVHASGLGPARLDHAQAVPGEAHDAHRVILGLRAIAVDEGAELGRGRLGRSLVVDPARELDPVAAHVHEHPAAGALGIPEPARVRPEVLLALAHEIHRPQRALVGQLLRPHVLGREAQLLGVHQEHSRLRAGGDHLVGLRQRARERLLADHVLAGRRGRNRDVAMQVVGGADADDVDVRLLDQRPVVGVVAGDAVLGREALGVPRSRRGDAAQAGGGHRLERLGVALGDEARPDQSDPDIPHGISLPQGFRLVSDNAATRPGGETR